MRRLLLPTVLALGLAAGSTAPVHADYGTPFKVYGAIGQHYDALGGPAGFLRQPLTSELGTPDGLGRYNFFQGGGSTGARAPGRMRYTEPSSGHGPSCAGSRAWAIR